MVYSVSGSRLFGFVCSEIKNLASAHWKKGALAVGLVALTALGYALYNDQIVQECLYPTPVCPDAPLPSIYRDWWCPEFMDKFTTCAVVTEAEKPPCTIPTTVCTEVFSQLSAYLPYYVSKLSGPLKAFALTAGSVVFSIGCTAHILTKGRPIDSKNLPPHAFSSAQSEAPESEEEILGVDESDDESDLFDWMDSVLESPQPIILAQTQQDDLQLEGRHVLQEKVHSYEESKKVALNMLQLDLGISVMNEKKICEKRFWKSPEEFFKNALKNGSVIVPITHPDKTIGAYFVVLDRIDENRRTVSIRDPYQGKAVMLSFDVFFSLSKPHGYKFIGVVR